LVDLRSILDAERPASQRAVYDRLMVQYALYEDAPASVMNFWFANKPASVERSALHFNVLLHSKASAADRAAAADAVLATQARMRTEGISADEATYEVVISALGRAGRTKEAAAAFDAMVAGGLVPRVAHYQLLIIAHARSNDVSGAESWSAKLKADKDMAPSREALHALVAAYQHADAKKHDAKIKACEKQLTAMSEAEQATQAADEPSGVQWQMHFKPVTSTGGDDKGAAAKGGDKKPAAKPAAKK
jgi:pentatricopeptide repeat protein